MAAVDEQELEFGVEVMSVLCGVKEVPNKPGVFIKDRSVHPEFSNRDIALEYMTDVVKKMQFSVPVKVDQQMWVEDEVLIYGNLVVTVEGTEEKEKVIIVGAHYDVQNNLSSCWRGTRGKNYLVTSGADDNTSGTVGCLTLLRRFTVRPPKYTTIVICFDGEEPGEWNGLAVGSEYFVKNFIPQNPGLTFVSSVIADMIGATPTTNNGFVVATSKKVDDGKLQNEASSHVHITTNITVLDPDSRLSVLKLSDSVNTAKAGIPTVLLSYLTGFNALPDFYHTERDTMEIINWKTFKEAVDLLEYLSLQPLPLRSGENLGPTPQTLLVQQLMEMGFTKEQSEFALIQTNNNLEQAINLLF